MGRRRAGLGEGRRDGWEGESEWEVGGLGIDDHGWEGAVIGWVGGKRDGWI